MTMMMRYEGKKIVPEVDMTQFKELRIFTPDGVKCFDTKGLAQETNYGIYIRNRLEKIIEKVFKAEGVLKFSNGEKVDLTMQVCAPKIIYKEK